MGHVIEGPTCCCHTSSGCGKCNPPIASTVLKVVFAGIGNSLCNQCSILYNGTFFLDEGGVLGCSGCSWETRFDFVSNECCENIVKGCFLFAEIPFSIGNHLRIGWDHSEGCGGTILPSWRHIFSGRPNCQTDIIDLELELFTPERPDPSNDICDYTGSTCHVTLFDV